MGIFEIFVIICAIFVFTKALLGDFIGSKTELYSAQADLMQEYANFLHEKTIELTLTNSEKLKGTSNEA